MAGKNIDVVYATFHVDVGETPFFISVDYNKSAIVITIRGTLSMKDIITDHTFWQSHLDEYCKDNSSPSMDTSTGAT